MDFVKFLIPEAEIRFTFLDSICQTRVDIIVKRPLTNAERSMLQLAAIMQRFDGLASNFRNFRRPCARIGAVDPLLGRCGDFSNGVWG
jgi:hypothetical protein